MGVYFSHGDARWSYTGFNSMRCKLGEFLGIEIKKVSEITNYPDYATLGKESAFYKFFDKSDCDGVIKPDIAIVLALWLKNFACTLNYLDYDRRAVFSLAQGMELAGFLNQDFTWS